MVGSPWWFCGVFLSSSQGTQGIRGRWQLRRWWWWWGFYVSFSFLYILDTLFMYLRSCDHFVIANLVLVYIYTFEVVITVLSLISPCVVSFLSLYICFLYLYAIYYFYFTLRCLDEFCLKCFRNTSCQNLSCHRLFSYKVFQEFVLW